MLLTVYTVCPVDIQMLGGYGLYQHNHSEWNQLFATLSNTHFCCLNFTAFFLQKFKGQSHDAFYPTNRASCLSEAKVLSIVSYTLQALLLEKGCYPLRYLEFLDCLLEGYSLQRLTRSFNICSTLTSVTLDYNE